LIEGSSSVQTPDHKPLLLFTDQNDSNQVSHNALQRIISICEIIKREYPKMFASPAALQSAQETAAVQYSGLSNPVVKLPAKQSKKLYQYNRLSLQPAPVASTSTAPVATTTTEDMEEDQVEEPDKQAAEAHSKALQTLVFEGKKRPRKKHAPKMEIILSARKVDWLHSADGWSCVLALARELIDCSYST
jgi:hypothetical protein